MYPSLRAFLAHLIDYAGMFPPASLALEPALASYLAYRREPDAWMLGRFICPVARLADLGRLIPAAQEPGTEGTAQSAISVAALGRKSAAAEFATVLADDLALIAACRSRHSPAVAIDAFELPLPPGPVAAATLARLAEAAHGAGLAVFCEVSAPLDAGWERATEQAVAALAAHNATGAPPLGFKLRTGGVTADAFPSPEQAAAALVAARDAGLAMKCTAGLHHPFRQYRDEVGTQMHGFVNVFAAGLLAHTHGLDARAVAHILADEEPAAFSFTPAGLAWRELAVPADEVARLRAAALVSYGSCSFDEPRDDLRGLGVLP